MDLTELESLKAQLRGDLAAVERVILLLGATAVIQIAAPESKANKIASAHGGDRRIDDGLTAAVYQAIADLPAEFEFLDLVGKCAPYPAAQVRNCIARLLRHGVVQVDGKGRHAKWSKAADGSARNNGANGHLMEMHRQIRGEVEAKLPKED